MCSRMRHIYDPDAGGCVMDKDITALRVLESNRGPGISAVFSLEWWRNRVICKARAPLREWQPQSINASFRPDLRGNNRACRGALHLIPPLPADYRAPGYQSLTSHSRRMLVELIDFLGVHSEKKMTMGLTWGGRKLRGRAGGHNGVKADQQFKRGYLDKGSNLSIESRGKRGHMLDL